MPRPFVPFALEAYFEEREFSVPHLAGVSDVEPLLLSELLALASDAERDAYERSSLGYTDVEGSLALREAIASTYDETISAADVLVTTGGQEAITAVSDVLGGPDVRALAVTPTYQSLYDCLRATAASVELLPLLDGGRAGFELDLNALSERLDGVSVLVLNAPSNPTGWSPAAEEWTAIVELAQAAGARLVVDEAYLGTERGGVRRAACESTTDGVSIGVVSKLHGLAGLRIGWVASRDHELLHQVRLRKHWGSICSPAPSETLAAIALSHQAELRQRALELVERGVEAADRMLAPRGDLVWFRPSAGTTAFVRLLNESGCSLADRAATAGVLVLPGSVLATIGPSTYGSASVAATPSRSSSASPACSERAARPVDGIVPRSWGRLPWFSCSGRQTPMERDDAHPDQVTRR